MEVCSLSGISAFDWCDAFGYYRAESPVSVRYVVLEVGILVVIITRSGEVLPKRHQYR